MKVFVAFVVLATIVNIALANAHHKKHHNMRNGHQKRYEIGYYSYSCTLCQDCQEGCVIYRPFIPIWGPGPVILNTTSSPTTTQPSARKRLSHHRSKHHKRDAGDSTPADTPTPTEGTTTTTEFDNTGCCDCQCPDKRKGHSKKAHHSQH